MVGGRSFNVLAAATRIDELEAVEVVILQGSARRPQETKLEGKYSLESTDPRESEIRAHLRP